MVTSLARLFQSSSNSQDVDTTMRGENGTNAEAQPNQSSEAIRNPFSSINKVNEIPSNAVPEIEKQDRPDSQRPSENDLGQSYGDTINSRLHGWQRANSPNTEDRDLAEAVKQSIHDQLKYCPDCGEFLDNGKPGPNGLRTASTVRDDLILLLSNEFSPLLHPEGDTMIYIGPPPRLPGQSKDEYNSIVKHFDNVMILPSSHLRAIGSRKFDKFLGPMSVRAERRLKKLGVLKNIGHETTSRIKYFIDLRPPNEDEEAIILLTDLSCTKGVLSWHLAKDKYGLLDTQVSGTDEFVNDATKPLVILPPTHQCKQSKEQSNTGKTFNEPPTQKTQQQQAVLGSEYSPIRHRSAIERLLQAIMGNDPKLDSAPKIWTYFALAKYFDCATNEKVNGWITAWIYGDRNVNFIQSNPEVVYRIGMGIESSHMVKDAFSILVGERALIDVYGEMDKSILNPMLHSVHGRQLELLDDDERNRVDHAASSLRDRVRLFVSDLLRDMSWLYQSSVYATIANIKGRNELERKALESALLLIQNYVRGKIYYVLCSSAEVLSTAFDFDFMEDSLDRQAQSAKSFHIGKRMCFGDTYNMLNQPMRVFTGSFWLSLRRCRLEEGNSNVHLSYKETYPKRTHLYEAMLRDFERDPYNGIKPISRDALNNVIDQVDWILQNQLEQDRNQNAESPDHDVLFLKYRDSRDYRPLNPVRTHARTSSTGTVEGLSLNDLTIQSPKRGSEESQTLQLTSEKRRKLSDVDNDVFPMDDISSPEAYGEGSSRANTRVFSQGPPSEAEKMISVPQNGTTTLKDFNDKNSQTNESYGEVIDNDFATIPTEVRETDQLLRQRTIPIRSRTGQVSQVFQDYGISTGILNRVRNFVTDQQPTFNPNQAKLPKSASEVLGQPNNESEPPMTVQGQTTSPAAQDTDNQSIEGMKSVRFEDYACAPISNPNVTQHNLRAGYVRHLDAEDMLPQLTAALCRKCEEILLAPHLFHGADRVPTTLVDTLLSLTDNEWKYLPLWAGGNDDGTGGVFDEADVPNLEAGGFRGGKRGIDNVKDYTAGGGVSDSGSSFDDINSEAISTVGRASKNATDGTETIKSFNTTSTGSDFLRQDEIYAQIQQMNIAKQYDAKGKGRASDWNPEPLVSGEEFDEAGDASTVMGTQSDSHGDMFHDLDDDDDDDDNSNDKNDHNMHEHGDNDGSKILNDSDSEWEAVAGTGPAPNAHRAVESDDDDIDIINDDEF